MMAARDAHCGLCGAPRRPTQKPVGSFGNGTECLRMREHREIPQGPGQIEISPQLLLNVSMWRNGGGLAGEHICDDCIVVGLKAAKRFVDNALQALRAAAPDAGHFLNDRAES